MFQATGLALRGHAAKRDEEARFWIGVFGQHLARGGDVQGQLFLQLAPRGGQVVFSRLEFAAGKLPQAGVALSGGALSQQEPPVPFNHRGDDARWRAYHQA